MQPPRYSPGLFSHYGPHWSLKLDALAETMTAWSVYHHLRAGAGICLRSGAAIHDPSSRFGGAFIVLVSGIASTQHPFLESQIWCSLRIRSPCLSTGAFGTATAAGERVRRALIRGTGDRRYAETGCATAGVPFAYGNGAGRLLPSGSARSSGELRAYSRYSAGVARFGTERPHRPGNLCGCGRTVARARTSRVRARRRG